MLDVRPLAALVLLVACGGEATPADPTAATPAPAAKARTLTLAAYTTPREVLADRILPAFQASWKAAHGEDVTFETSYQGSGAQARAVVGGLEADVVFLSLEPDVRKIVDAGLITHDWKAGPNAGIVSTSLVVIGVRPGNPKGITTWADLAKPGTSVLTPNVKTSGGAMWNVLALATSVAKGPGTDDAGARTLLSDVLRNVGVMDKSGRDSMISFEKGVGDAVITYENEVVVSKKAGTALDYVVPPTTILIENPAAVVDGYADKHGNRDVADAFVAFLSQPEQQKAFAEYGLRPIGQPADGFPAAGTVVKVADLGGWPAVEGWLFADGTLYDQALTSAQSQAGK